VAVTGGLFDAEAPGIWRKRAQKHLRHEPAAPAIAISRQSSQGTPILDETTGLDFVQPIRARQLSV
jgi:hypothetical protein